VGGAVRHERLPGETGSKKAERKVRKGCVTAPHGVAFDGVTAMCSLSEYNITGA